MRVRIQRVLKWAGALAGVAGLGLVAWWQWGKDRQPVYEGRPLLAWVKELGSTNGQERERAGRAVRSLGTNGLGVLVRVVGRGESVLREPVLRSRRSLPRELWWPLYRLVRPYEAEQEQALAAEALGLLGPGAEPAAPVLAWALAEGQPRVRLAAAGALRQIGKGGVPWLVKALSRGQGAHRQLACSALAQMGPEAAAAAPELVRVLGEEDAQLRALGLAALGAIGPPAIGPLLARLAEGSVRERKLVIEALVRVGCGSYEGMEGLLAASQDGRPEARAGVMEALGEVVPAGPRTVKVLAEGLGDPVAEVRLRAAEALRALAGRSRFVTNAVEALQERVTDQEEAVRAAAVEALRAISEAVGGRGGKR